ncbi:MAG: STAS-like domain-containing protein [Spirochaetes bacterium]|nr:STAS-like domain-containing protein [Spirochaetota bacterium]
MNPVIKISDKFGTFCADGSEAVEFLKKAILPRIESGEKLTLSLEDVRNVSSSFANAFFANLSATYGNDLNTKVVIVNCRDHLKPIISSAFSLGLKRREEHLSHVG